MEMSKKFEDENFSAEMEIDKIGPRDRKPRTPRR
jgi:hypothetical protein